MAQYIALLRGINVGGNNIIKMTDLKACFEDMGFNDVATYIQSGNVMFSSSENDSIRLAQIIEKTLSEKFNYTARVVIVQESQLAKIVREAPPGFGQYKDLYRYDVLFLRPEFTATEVIKMINTKEGVDNAYAGDKVLYFSRLISKASQSHLTKVIALPVYQQMTIRNWNTTTQLLSMLENRSNTIKKQ